MARAVIPYTVLLSALTFASCKTTDRTQSSAVKENGADAGSGDFPEVQTRDQFPVPVAHLRDGIAPTPVCVEGEPVPLNQECKLPEEDALNVQITQAAVKFQAFQNPKNGADPLSKRDFHPQSTACVAATFEVEPGLSPELQKGVFAAGNGAGHKYKAVIRYSNGSPAIKKDGTLGMNADGTPDARAMAVKVVGVDGTPLLSTASDEPGQATQDFMLTDFPVFFLRNIKSAIAFFPGLLNGTAGASLDSLEKFNLVSGRKVIADVFDETYWSQGPYHFGDDVAAKYMVRPVACDAPVLGRAPGGADQNFLRQNAQDRLKTGAVCFDFFVQRQKDVISTPVEDAAVEWKEADAPPVKIARITIPGGQDVMSKERHSFCENLSFSPWNGIPAHRPLGSINRIRLTAYSGISNKRRLENQVAIGDPTGSEGFFQVLSKQ